MKELMKIISIFSLIIITSCNGQVITSTKESYPSLLNTETYNISAVFQQPQSTPSDNSIEYKFPNKLELANWVKNSKSNILSNPERQDNGDIIVKLFGDTPYENIYTGFNSFPKGLAEPKGDPELFGFKIPDDTFGYFWLDSNRISFLNSEKNQIAILNITTGNIVFNNINESSQRYLYDKPKINIPFALIASTNDPKDDSFIMIYEEERNEYSYDWKYKAYYDVNIASIAIEEIETQIKTKILKTENVTLSYWPHSNSDNLLITQGECGADNCTGKKIDVYNIITKQTIFTKEINNYELFAGWSWDDRSIIYKVDHGVPCIIDIDNKKEKCLEGYLQPSKEYDLYYIDDIEQIDNENIAYTINIISYIVQISKIPQSDEIGKFCIFNIKTLNNYCPIEGLDTDGQIPGMYKLSPNNKLAIIEIGSRPCYCDLAEISKHIMISIDSKNKYPDFRILDNSSNRLNSLEYLWRPISDNQ